MKRAAKILAGSVWFFLCLILGIKLFFPAEAVGQRLIYGVEQASGGSFVLVLDDLGAWTLSGLKADDVQLLRKKKKRGRRASDEDGPAPTLFAALDAISARVQILPLLGGSQLLTLKGSAYDGSIDGELGLDGQIKVLDLDVEDLDLSLYPASLPDGEALQLVGRLTFESDLRLDPDDVDNSTGDIRLEIENLAVLNEAFADSFDEALVEFENDDGKLVIKKGSFQGEKIQAELSGDIQLNKRIGKSRLDIKIQLNLDTSYDMLAKASGLKRARDKEGVYHFQCTGTLERRRCRSDRTAARGKTNKRDRPNRAASGRVESDQDNERFSPDESAEERRERRQERIKKRRERTRDRRGLGSNGDRARPDADRSRRDRRDPEELDEFEPEEPPFEDEPPFDDDLPLPDLEEMDIEDERFQDDRDPAGGDPFLDE
jgi:type II secretion system protein N